MTRSSRGFIAATTLAALLAVLGSARADPDELMPCKRFKVTARGVAGITRFLCKPPRGGFFALPSAMESTVYYGVDTVPSGSPVSGTSCRGRGDPPGSTGYSCGSLPSIHIVITPRGVRGVARGGPSLSAAADLALKILLPASPKYYCARVPLGSALENTSTVFRAKDVPAPTACSPSGAFLDADL
jgi:hypothetical protein